ncbi:MAG: carbamoyltransferase [Cyclobacteriaceae bacterium]|jgi:carbamoyltransferase
MDLNILGISALYHDSACCIMQNGKLSAAAQEERFTRKKHDASMPYHAMMYCLEDRSLSITDIDYLAYYENPEKKLARQLWSGHCNSLKEVYQKLDPHRAERDIREVLGYEGPIKIYDHHQSHAASSYYYSGFESAAVMTVDGVGEWATTTYGLGKGSKLDIFEEVNFPNSIGLLYSTITSYLGFRVNNGEYKVMGLAPYGKPKYVDKIRGLITLLNNGQYELKMEYFDFIRGEKMYTPLLAEHFGQTARELESEVGQFHADVAKSLQLVLEEIMLSKARYIHNITGEKNLCLAGGVALNCVANGKILRDGPFENIFVQPASNDAGCSLGAAALAHVEVTGKRPFKEKMNHVYLGPKYSDDEIDIMMEATSIKWNKYQEENQLIEQVANRLADGKVIGWYQQRMEFGPRSLGARSILADPQTEDMRDRINKMVKKREQFRPFAPAVLAEKASEHFDLDHPSPFMLETCQVNSKLKLPAITHCDNSARVQTVSDQTNPRFARLLRRFDELTGCPILLNTSFNVRGEPIVCTPEDALKCFISTEIDCLVLENVIIDRSENSLELLQWLVSHQQHNSEISNDVYTFI